MWRYYYLSERRRGAMRLLRRRSLAAATLRSIGSLSGIQFLGIFEWKTFEKTAAEIFLLLLDSVSNII